jgi:hypothetical protein
MPFPIAARSGELDRFFVVDKAHHDADKEVMNSFALKKVFIAG